MWSQSLRGVSFGKTVIAALISGLAPVGVAIGQEEPLIELPTVLPLNVGAQNFATAAMTAPDMGCRQTRTNGSGITAFNWCFSDHGNVNMLEHSEGLEHIGVGTITEGFCLAAGFTQRARTDGSDGQFGLEAPTYPSNTKVVNRTLDGEFRIEQRFVQSAGAKQLIIIMKIKNISTSPINDVFLTRYVDVDMSNTTNDIIIAASRSVAAIEPGSARLELIPKTENFNANSMVFDSFVIGSILDGDCYNADADNLDEQTGDGGMGVQYQLGTIFPDSSKTVRFVYDVSI